MGEIISLLLAYIIGSISFSFLIAKKLKGLDIRQHGSKNAGATNTLRVLGRGPAAIVLVLDALKGSIAVLIAMQLTAGEPKWMMAAGLLAIIGHNWSIFLKFKGGKGIATTIGVVAIIGFLPGLMAGIMGIMIIFFFRYISLGSIVFTSALPFMMILFYAPIDYIYGSLAITTLSILRHIPNIERLVKGEENKLGKSD